MNHIEQAFSSCRAAMNYVSDSYFLQAFIAVFFLLFISLKLSTTLYKTKNKVAQLELSSYKKTPKKLASILEKNSLPTNLFFVSKTKKVTAVATGWFTKKIFISNTLLSQLSNKELEAVVLHEFYHSKNHHSTVLFVAELVTSLFFLVPLFKDLQQHLESELEKAADSYAVGKQQTTTYIKSSLKKLLLSSERYDFFPQFSYHIIDQRIDQLNSKKTRIMVSPQRAFISFITTFVFVSMFFLNQRYALASELSQLEEKITCSLATCVYNCVSYELKQAPLMSEVNFSAHR